MTKAFRTALCVAILAALGGCGAETPAPPTDPYDGNWVGSLPEAFRRVRFTIAQSRITYFAADVRFPTCWVNISGHPNASITGNQFSFTIGDVLVSSIHVSGTIDSERTLSGTLGSGTLLQTFCSTQPGYVTAVERFTAEQ